MAKFFTLSYWFDLRPAFEPTTIKWMLVLFAAMIVAAIVIKIIKQQKKWSHYEGKLVDKYFALLMTMAIIGLGLTWLKYESINLLSARFWLLAWALVLLAWLYPIIKYQLKVVPTAKKQAEEHKLFRKYLPSKK